MRVTLHDVAKGRAGQALPETTLAYESGAVTYALAETEQRPTVLGLIATGRMTPDAGRVLLDGAPDARSLRRRSALIDAPEANDPHSDVALVGVVAEELMFAGKPSTPLHARRWLAALGFADIASWPIGTVSPAARVRIFCELAVLRSGVDALVIVHPDRHGGAPDEWSGIAEEFADRGYAVLVIIGGSAAAALGVVDAVYAPAPTPENPDEPASTPRAAAEHADAEPDDPEFPATAPETPDAVDPAEPTASAPAAGAIPAPESPDEPASTPRVATEHADAEPDDPEFPASPDENEDTL